MFNQASAQQVVQTEFGTLSLFEIESQGASKMMPHEVDASFHAMAQGAEYEGSYHLILKFEDIISSAGRLELARKGVFLEHYLPEKAYVAQVATRASLSELRRFGLEAFGVAKAEHKVSPSFRQALREQTAHRYTIRSSFSANVSPTDVRAELRRMTDVADVIVHERTRHFTASMSAAAIKEVAAWPFIYRIEPHSFMYESEGSGFMGDYEESVASDVQVTQIRANVIKSDMPGHLGLTGSGVATAVADVPYQGPSHIDLRGKHHVLDPGISNNGEINDHGNHVTGIVAGDGSLRPRFEGLAPKATVYTMRTESPFSLGLEQSDPMVISSNSWSSSDPVYGDWYEQKGRYNINSQTIDLLLREEQTLLSVFSAGNSGGTQPGFPANYLMLNPSYGAAKNTLVVGRYGGPIVPSLTPSFGPARDGRIKPDLVAQNRVYSGISLNQYGRRQGSSQSTPAVSGAAALLVEHYRNKNAGNTPDAGLVKAIMMNTSDYIYDQGPSFTAGWGLVNARRAAAVISAAQHVTGSLDHTEQVEIPIEIPSDVDGKAVAQVKVMVYWGDKEASPYAASALVNNLDLVVTDGVTDHLPWVLDTTPAAVANPATQGVDSLNNVEQVAIDAPASGTMTARISGTSVPYGPQPFYLVYSFVLDELLVTHPTGGEKFFSGQNQTVFWDSQYVGDDRDAEDVAYSLDGGATWKSFHGISNITRVASSFTVPQAPLGLVQIRVTLKGESVVSEPFTISERLDLELDIPDNGAATASWNAISGAASYELLLLNGDNTWSVVHTGVETTVTMDAGWVSGRSAWVAVRAYDASGSIQSQRSDAKHFVPTNSNPVAVADDFSVSTGGFLQIDVLANDTDADGDALYVTGIGSAANGRASLMDNQIVRYFPNTGFAGIDSFSYTIVDGMGGASTGTINVSVVSGVASETESALPTDVVLAPNYPNPFNPRTTLRFAMPAAAPVTLLVYDATGRRVAILIDGYREAGWHQATFDASSLSSGVYFYQLRSGAISRTRSMLVLK